MTALVDRRGAAAAELAVLIPGFVLILGLMISGGRVWFARTTVVEAAQTSARAASLERSAATAGAAGREAGRRSLSTAGLSCASASVAVDTRAFASPAGIPGTISARVDCTVRLSDLGIRFLPGSIELTGRADTALDTYRARR